MAQRQPAVERWRETRQAIIDLVEERGRVITYSELGEALTFPPRFMGRRLRDVAINLDDGEPFWPAMVVRRTGEPGPGLWPWILDPQSSRPSTDAEDILRLHQIACLATVAARHSMRAGTQMSQHMPSLATVNR